MANVILSLLFFMMGLAVLVAFISPINSMLDIAQNSQNLNCYGFINPQSGDVNDTLSFNATKNGGNSGNSLTCIAIKLYLPYIFLIFLVGGLALILAGKAGSMLGLDDQQYPGAYG